MNLKEVPVRPQQGREGCKSLPVRSRRSLLYGEWHGRGTIMFVHFACWGSLRVISITCYDDDHCWYLQ
jgi:hypothetical protein